jgi:hypothetical protein
VTIAPPSSEPEIVLNRPRPFWSSWYGAAFVPGVVVASLGLGLMGLDLAQPGPYTVDGIMASKSDYFKDPVVQELLAERGFTVNVTTRGSREVADEVIASGPETFDFAFPSGKPAANLISNARRAAGQPVENAALFTSPVVLASFREYAETLVDNGAATPRPHPAGEEPLYYDLDMDRFMKLGLEHRSWDDLGVQEHGIRNGNVALARTSGACRSNSGATYLALVAYVASKDVAPADDGLDLLADRIRPLFTAEGMHGENLMDSYLSADGKSQGPIVVVYEHQYLAHQIGLRQRGQEVDTSRVLLYPDREFLSDPELLYFTQDGRALSEVLATSPELRARMTELGFRVYGEGSADTTGTTTLYEYLERVGVATPGVPPSFTVARFPELDTFERLIVETFPDCGDA